MGEVISSDYCTSRLNRKVQEAVLKQESVLTPARCSLQHVKRQDETPWEFLG